MKPYNTKISELIKHNGNQNNPEEATGGYNGMLILSLKKVRNLQDLTAYIETCEGTGFDDQEFCLPHLTDEAKDTISKEIIKII